MMILLWSREWIKKYLICLYGLIYTVDTITTLYREMGDLRQDYESMKKVFDVVESMKFEYAVSYCVRALAYWNNKDVIIFGYLGFETVEIEKYFGGHSVDNSS